ncbi:MAG TPA: 4-hydroxy-3-methylbut-2-enyl diphosphate reductase [bacterium]|nr:4-hydroxy-3-methylbut-2-enyl diphosphate reductase [bacterium]
MKIVIDAHAGFCPGVLRAVQKAEKMLAHSGELISLGALIHNPVELQRLQQMGLITRPQEEPLDAERLSDLKDRRVLVRTHGLAAAGHEALRQAGAQVEDATCSTVRRVQTLIAEKDRQGEQIVIIGKKNHAEVIGLAGYSRKPLLIEREADLEGAVFSDRVAVFSQTTFDRDRFFSLAKIIQDRVRHATVHDTTCRHITKRLRRLVDFAASVDVLLLIGGSHSSNSRVLFEACRAVNERSFKIEGVDELDRSWLRPADTVGISGGASTPRWQLEKVRDYLLELSAQ